MSLVKFRPRNHRQQVLVRGADPAVDDRATAPEVFDPLNERFGFTVDVAAAPHNAKVGRYFSVVEDGLEQSWRGERVWCNPPYSQIAPWVEKAWDEWTEQTWWQDMVEPFRDRPDSSLRVEFLRGRLRFIAAGKTEVGPNERPPFGCCLLIWGVC